MRPTVPPFDPLDLRRMLGTYISGVTVITAVDRNSAPVGFTANSFTSVSMEPPLLSVCPARTLNSFAIFDGCDHFAVNILAENQQKIANIFASDRSDRFAQIQWHRDTNGVPLIDGATSQISCRTWKKVAAGDHIILIGEIMAFTTGGEAGLGYACSNYFGMSRERQAHQLALTARRAVVGAIVENAHRVLLLDSPRGWHPPRLVSDRYQVSLNTLQEYFRRLDMSVDFGQVFSIFEDRDDRSVNIYYRSTIADSGNPQLGSYISVEDVMELRFESAAIKSMMQRYVDERRENLFGLYLGSASAGSQH